MAKKRCWIVLFDGTRTLVDPMDARWARGLKWHANGSNYACRTVGGRDKARKVFLHGAIYERILGRKIPRNMVIDHKNRNRRDNRRSNLRMVTVRTNNLNRSNLLMWDGERWIYEPHGRL